MQCSPCLPCNDYKLTVPLTINNNECLKFSVKSHNQRIWTDVTFVQSDYSLFKNNFLDLSSVFNGSRDRCKCRWSITAFNYFWFSHLWICACMCESTSEALRTNHTVVLFTELVHPTYPSNRGFEWACPLMMWSNIPCTFT